MIRAATFVLLLSTAALPAMALSEPVAGKEDPHVRTAAYSQFNRTLIIATVGRVTNITFGKDERIKRVNMGRDDGPIAGPDPKKLGPSPLQNNLPITGVSEGAIDMVVYTLVPDGNERVYQFLIKVRKPPEDDADDATATYGLVFNYPREEQKVAQEQATVAWRAKKANADRKLAEDRLAVDPFYGVRNWKFLAQGRDRDIAPTEASDNGRLTAFRYPGNMELPTVYTVDAEGNEHTAPVTIKDDLIVVQQTAPHFRLRKGPQVIEVWNKGWDPIGQNPGTGTGDPSVVRRVIVTK